MLRIDSVWRGRPASKHKLVVAVASGGHSRVLLEAIEQGETQLRTIDERLLFADGSNQARHAADITEFVASRLSNLRELLNGGVTLARAELLRHVQEIRLIPKQTDSGPDYVAVRE